MFPLYMYMENWRFHISRNASFCFYNIKIVRRLFSHADSVVVTSLGPSRPLPVVDPSVLSIFRAPAIEGENAALSATNLMSSDMGWYCPWLAEQISNIPGSLKNLLNSEKKSDSLIHLTVQSKLYRIFMSVSEFIR